MSNILYEYETPAGYGGAPRMRPLYNGGVINVHDEFPWTLSPQNVKQYIPYIELQEFRQNFSSELIGLVQNIAGNAQNLLLAGGVASTGEAVRDLLLGKAITGAGGALGRVATGAAATVLDRIGLGDFVRREAGQILQTGIGAAQALRNQTIAINLASNSLDNINKDISPDMDPYSKLYSANPTGFIYKIPYLSVDNFMAAGGSWNPANEKGTVQQGLQAVQTYLTRGSSKSDALSPSSIAQAGYDAMDALDKIAKGAVGAAPGVAAEVLKSFTPSSDGESIKITFYLSNTIGTDIKTIQKNWEFLYLLTYQNLPNRRSINLLDPPCLYRIKIPGVKTYPVAIIDSLKVTNEGTTRKVNIKTGEISKVDGPDIKTIPEVYKVSISIKSLLITTQNIFHYSEANQEKVNVITEKFRIGNALYDATKGQVPSLDAIENISREIITPTNFFKPAGAAGPSSP